MNGFFLTLDGIDGAGKSTHLRFILRWLAQHGIVPVFTREPGGTELGERLRELLLHGDCDIGAESETLLMFAARAQLLREVILPTLRRGLWAVSDRFTDATFAYQCGGRGLPYEKIRLLEQWVQGDLRPDMTVILDLPADVAFSRLHAPEQDRFERQSPEFFSRVREVYLRRARENPETYAVVRSDRDIAEVQKDIDLILSGCLKRFRERKS